MCAPKNNTKSGKLTFFIGFPNKNKQNVKNTKKTPRNLSPTQTFPFQKKESRLSRCIKFSLKMQNDKSLIRFINEQNEIVLPKRPKAGAKSTRSSRIVVKRKPINDETSKRNLKNQIRGLEDKLSIFAHEKATAETKAGHLVAENKLFTDEIARLRSDAGEKGKSDFFKAELENQRKVFQERERTKREFFEKREKDLIEKVEKLAEFKNKFYDEKQTSNALKEELDEIKNRAVVDNNNNRHQRREFSSKRKWTANNEYKSSSKIMPNSIRK